MSEKDNIEDWYKDQLSNYEVNPDSNGWDSISNQLDDAGPITEENVESWYVRELEKFQSSPDQAVWNKLATKLDVTSVWDKLLVSLNRYERLIWWRNTALKGTAVLLLLFGGYYTITNINDDSEDSFLANYSGIKTESVSTEKESTSNDQYEEQAGHHFSESSKLKNSSQNSEAIGAGTFSKSSNVYKQRVNTAPKLTEIVNRDNALRQEKVVKEESLLASVDKNNIDRINALRVGEISEGPIMFLVDKKINEPTLEANTIEAKEFLVKKEQNRIVFNSKRFSSHFVFGMYARRFYLGLNAGVKYQTLFVSAKQNELLSNFTKDQLMDFGSSMGATVGMIISDKFNLEANVNMLSTSGCKHQYSNGINSFTEELNLSYSTVSVLAKKMNNKSTFDNKKYSTNYIGGVYAGILNAAENSSERGSVDVKSHFSNVDLGIVLGIEQDRYITKEFVITPGVRFNQSILNTAKQSNEMMSASRNFSVEFNVGLKYIFLKKN